TLQPYSQTTKFLNQVFSTMPRLFKGVLRISSSAAISVVGLRGRYNERSDFLITTTPPTDETALPTYSPAYFPHLVDGGGYTTQLILFSNPGQSTSTDVLFFGQDGSSLNLSLR